MVDQLMGVFLRRFLLEELRRDRDLSANTQRSYRDTFRILMRFLKSEHGLDPDVVAVEQVDAEKVRAFLVYLETMKACGASTLNQRLAAIRSLFRFIGEQEPALISQVTSIRRIHFRRVAPPIVTYLEQAEIDALVEAPDQRTPMGRRDHALLLFLYNTGARASEATGVTIASLTLEAPYSVRLRGKGRKERMCPLWPHTARILRDLIGEQTPGATPTEHVFLNQRDEPLTRFGVHTLVERHVKLAASTQPSLSNKRISPHTIRHTTAVHLLRSGVDINTIRAWLGHVSVDTTNRYAEIDLEMKAKALETCAASLGSSRRRRRPPWRSDQDLMTFLTSR